MVRLDDTASHLLSVLNDMLCTPENSRGERKPTLTRILKKRTDIKWRNQQAALTTGNGVMGRNTPKQAHTDETRKNTHPNVGVCDAAENAIPEKHASSIALETRTQTDKTTNNKNTSTNNYGLQLSCEINRTVDASVCIVE